MQKKAELIDALAEQTGVSKTDTKAILDALPGVVTEALRTDAKCVLPGIGTLTAKERPARQGRNPQTGEPMQIAASKAASLKPIKSFKDGLNS